MISKQETFTIVAKHLLSMDEQSTRGGAGRCAYRGDGGRKCAVGILIPDELYTQDMEQLGVRTWRIREVLEKLGHDVELCAALQNVHDNHWLFREASLRRIAKIQGLEMP